MTSEFLKAVREFVSQEVDPERSQFDILIDEPLPLYEKFRAAGLANWWLPKEYGGRGLSLTESVDIVNEIAYGDAGVAFTLFLSILGSTAVSLYGSDDLKNRYLGTMAARGSFCAVLGSERNAGSELSKIETVAQRVGNELVISGEKFFATNADFADFLLVLARAADDTDESMVVLVPRDTPGIEIVKRWDIIGLRASYCYQVNLHKCRVPAANQLPGIGLRLFESALNASRTLIAAMAIGLGRRMRDHCIDYAKSKSFRGGTLLGSPVFVQKVGQMEMLLDVMKSHCLKAAGDFDSVMNEPDPAAVFSRRGTLKSAVTAKIFCGQAGWEIASMASEMFGGLGYANDLPIGKLVRDIRCVSIGEGGDDVLRELIFYRYVIPAKNRV